MPIHLPFARPAAAVLAEVFSADIALQAIASRVWQEADFYLGLGDGSAERCCFADAKCTC